MSIEFIEYIVSTATTPELHRKYLNREVNGGPLTLFGYINVSH